MRVIATRLMDKGFLAIFFLASRWILLPVAISVPLTAERSALVQNPDSNEMILIPGGVFVMGNDTGPEDEQPAHRVELSAFLISRTPVTNAQIASFLNARGVQSAAGKNYYEAEDSDARIHRRGNQWVADAGFENHPVVEVTWLGAREYCTWTKKRLPTEAEWEKAARGSDNRKYPWGNDPPDRSRAQFESGWNETALVGSFPNGASPYGVLDLAGNVWEWVSSAYSPYPYDASDGRESPEPGPVRSTRGGGHDSSAEGLSTTQRGRNLSRNPASGHHNIGFRCAETPTI